MRYFRLLVGLLLAATVALAGCGSSGTTDNQGTPASSSVAAAGGGSDTATHTGTTTSTGTGTSTVSSADCPAENTTSFAKTKFVLHTGLAAGTFHRWIYKPFKAGTFKKGADGRIRAMVKAGAIALFDVHEVKKAIADVKANPTLCKVLYKPLSALQDQFSKLKSKIIHGDTSSLEGIEGAVTSVSSLSSANGVAITENSDENADSD